MLSDTDKASICTLTRAEILDELQLHGVQVHWRQKRYLSELLELLGVQADEVIHSV